MGLHRATAAERAMQQDDDDDASDNLTFYPSPSTSFLRLYRLMYPACDEYSDSMVAYHPPQHLDLPPARGSNSLSAVH